MPSLASFLARLTQAVRRHARAWKAGLTAAALAYLVWVVDPAAIGAALGAVEVGGLLVALALVPVNVGLDAWVWRLYVRPLAPDAPPRRVLGAVLCGFALGFFTPARVGEYAGRAVYLGAGDRWAVAATIFVQRMADMAVSVGVGAAALAAALYAGVLAPSPAWWAVLAGGALLSGAQALLVVQPRLAARLLAWALPSSERVQARAAFLRQIAPRDAWAAWALSVARYGIFVAQFVLLVGAFVPGTPWRDAAWGVALTFFAKFLIPSVTLMDLGIREGAAVFFFARLGLPEAVAFNAALLVFLANVVLPSVAGVPFVWRMDRTPAQQTDGTAAQQTNGAAAQGGAGGEATDGAAADAREGTAREGTAREGTAREGTAREGTAREGTAEGEDARGTPASVAPSDPAHLPDASSRA